MKPLLLSFSLILFLLGCHVKKTESNQVLWYRQPAKEWEDCFPLGNGRLGIMVFGDPSEEHIQLNDDSMWPGDNGVLSKSKCRKYFLYKDRLMSVSLEPNKIIELHL